MEDSRALDDLAGELERCTLRLVLAIERAERGHRGETVRILPTVNACLARTGYVLEREDRRR